MVRTGTREENILDYIFSYGPFTRETEVEVNMELTDHGTVMMDYVMTNTEGNKAKRINPFLTRINDFNLDRMDETQKAKLRERLLELLEAERDNMEGMEVGELQDLIINSYEPAVSELASPRKRGDPNRKARPPKEVRKHNNIRKLCSRKLLNKILTEKQRERLFDKIEESEIAIRAYDGEPSKFVLPC